MNDLISLDYFSDECSDLCLIHSPYLIESSIVTFFKVSEFLLQFFELLGNALIVFSKLHIRALKTLVLIIVLVDLSA